MSCIGHMRREPYALDRRCIYLAAFEKGHFVPRQRPLLRKGSHAQQTDLDLERCAKNDGRVQSGSREARLHRFHRHRGRRRLSAAARARGWRASREAPDRHAQGDDGGYLLQLERADGAHLESPGIATLKARTAAVSRQSTQYWEQRVEERKGFLALSGFIPLQGGIPLLHQGQCVGGIGVSGVTSPQCEQIARAGAAVLG